jgi:hypothetical protein
MAFDIFDSIQVLSQSNSRLFGFTSFSKDFFHTLHLGCRCYHDSRFKKTGVAADRQSLRQYFDAVKGFNRRQNDVKFLQQASSWYEFSRSAQHNVVLQQQLTETQEDFKRHERFSAHSNESLLEAYEKLNDIEKLLILALKEVSQAKRRLVFGRVPRNLLKAYRKYLIQQWAILKQEREDIVMHMLARLNQAAEDPSLENTDTLPTIIKELKSKAFLKSTYTSPKISEDSLTKDLFHKFHEIIHKEGSSEITSVLHALPWFRKRTSLARLYEVEELIPKSHKKPGFLFFGSNLRFHWFDDFHNLAKIDSTLHYLRTAHVTGDSTFHSLSHRMVSLYSAQQALNEELNRLKVARENCKKGLRKYFCKADLLFLEALEKKLKQKQIRLISQKINLLKFIAVAPHEELQQLKIYDFIDSIEADITPKIRIKCDRQVATIQKTLDVYFEEHLKNYLCQWSSASSLKRLGIGELEKLHVSSEEQEKVLMTVLPKDWNYRLGKMQKLRRTNQLLRLETSAGLNLTKLLVDRPSVLHKIIRSELCYLHDCLVDYIKNYVQDFNYADQKNILAQMISELGREDVCEAETSTQLLQSERMFLKQFPEINFFINSLLKLKKTEDVLVKLHNPCEVESQISSLYRFIQFQETKFLTKNKAKFVTLFCKSDAPAENRVSIHQLRRAII